MLGYIFKVKYRPIYTKYVFERKNCSTPVEDIGHTLSIL